MANKFFGEVEIESGGNKYKLRMDFNAMCEFEDVTGVNAMDAFADFEKGKISVKNMRAMMYAFLKRHQPDITLDQAGEILSENMGALEAVVSAAMPSAKETEGLGKPKG
jgi:hypothetical protein